MKPSLHTVAIELATRVLHLVGVLSDFAPTGAKPCFPPFATHCFYSPREGTTVSHPTPKSQFGAKSDRTATSST
jgi:hypothetical protein